MDHGEDLASAFRAAVERGDADAATALFAPDCVFNSPIVHRPYVGPVPLRAALGAVLQVFACFRYTGAYFGGDRECQGVDILRGDDERLTELTVLVRPYSAATLLREQMAALLT